VRPRTECWLLETCNTVTRLLKVNSVYSALWETHLTATERHLPYGMTQCYRHPTQVNAPHLNPSQPGWYLMYLPGGIKGWVYLGAGYILKCFSCPQTVTHPSSYHLIARSQTHDHLIVKSNTLTVTQLYIQSTKYFWHKCFQSYSRLVNEQLRAFGTHRDKKHVAKLPYISTKCASVKILKIGKYLARIWTKVWWDVFDQWRHVMVKLRKPTKRVRHIVNTFYYRQFSSNCRCFWSYFWSYQPNRIKVPIQKKYTHWNKTEREDIQEKLHYCRHCSVVTNLSVLSPEDK